MKYFKTEFILPKVLSIFPVLSVFFSEKLIPFVVVVLLAFLFLFENIKKRDFKNSLTLMRPFIFYVGVYVLYTFFSNDLSQALKLLERQVIIIVMPLIIFSSNLNKERILVFMKTYIYVMLFITILSVFVQIKFLIDFEEWINFMKNEKGKLSYVQFKYPHLMGVHPTYWSYLIVLINILLLNNKTLNILKNTNFVTILLIIFNVNLLYLSARTPILINILIHSIFFFSYFAKRKKNRFKILLYLALFLVLLPVFLSQPLMFSKISNILNDDRFFLWPKAFEIIKNNYFILGEGLGVGNDILKFYIFNIDDTRSDYFGIDLHNQYLKAYLDMGVLGFLSLIYMIIYPFIISFQRHKHLLLNLCFSLFFLISILTESTFYVIKGIVIFTVFSSVLVKLTITPDERC